MKKIYVQLFLFIALSNGANAAIKDTIRDPLRDFRNYHKTNYQELIYIHFDKPYYLAGERIKFKVYCLEKFSSTPSKLSRVAYVELIDEDKTSHLKAKINLENGTGYGDLFIPTNLISNNYIIRGYTRWMRNYGPESYFHSMITVINPFKRPELPPIPKHDEVIVKFTSEGGPLINNHTTKIVCEIKDVNGDPVPARGRLMANDSILVVKFESTLQSPGSFEITPEITQKYHIELTHPDNTITNHDFLPIVRRGLSMKVREDDHRYSVEIFCNDISIVGKTEELFAMIYQKGRVIKSDIFSLSKEWHAIELEKADLEDGIFTAVLFKINGEFLLERKVFKYSKKAFPIAPNIDKPEYNQREKIVLDLSAVASLFSDNRANISLSIGAFHPNYDNYLHLNEYLLIKNSLNEVIYNLGNHFRNPVSEASKSINDLLIVHARSDREIWSDNREKEHIAECRAPLVTGSVRNKITGEPAGNVMTYLSVPGKRLQFYPTRSKSDGSFIFELKDFYRSNEIIVQNNYTKDTMYTIDLDSPFSREYLDIDLPALKIDEEMKDWIVQQSENMQIELAYLKYKPKLPSLSQIDSASFFYEPDSRYFLDDYTRFIVMEEVMREYVTGVYVRKNSKGFQFMTLDQDRNILFEENPLMLLDAVPVFDANEILALDPLKVEKIETIKSRFHYGFLDCRGIVSYTTYKGDLGGYMLNKNALVFPYDGMQPRKQYQYPEYPTASDSESKIPDFRNTLYWVPELILSDQKSSIVEFYCSDYASEYEIRIEGIDRYGKSISARGMLKVKEKSDN
ncbi:MAG: hypothetical protein MI975_18105 [Cytophagales bacterium]|nr:hypothetical protein [Cytophagales bacterium]